MPPVCAGGASAVPVESHVTIGGITIFGTPLASRSSTVCCCVTTGVRPPVLRENRHLLVDGAFLSLMVSFTEPGVTS